MDDRSSLRRFECPQCGGPLASMTCEYCGSVMVHVGGDNRTPGLVESTRSRIEVGLVRGTATYLDIGW